MNAMKPAPDNIDTPDLVENEEAFREAVKEGVRAADEGRVISHEEMRRWLLSWGTSNELPRPECK